MSVTISHARVRGTALEIINLNDCGPVSALSGEHRHARPYRHDRRDEGFDAAFIQCRPRRSEAVRLASDAGGFIVFINIRPMAMPMMAPGRHMASALATP